MTSLLTFISQAKFLQITNQDELEEENSINALLSFGVIALLCGCVQSDKIK